MLFLCNTKYVCFIFHKKQQMLKFWKQLIKHQY